MDLTSFDSLGQRRVFFVMLLLAAGLAAMTPPWGMLAFVIAAGVLGVIATAVEIDLKKQCDERKLVLNVTKWRYAAVLTTFLSAIVIALTYSNWASSSYNNWIKLAPVSFSLILYVFSLIRMSGAARQPQTA